jgi:general secretion pathway protein G
MVPEDAAQIELQQLQMALRSYRMDVGDYPTTAQGLQALKHAPDKLPEQGKWGGPYFDKPALLDPWDRPYQYEYSQGDEHPRIWSLGADGRDGTDDDIGVDWSTTPPPDTTLEALEAPGENDDHP